MNTMSIGTTLQTGIKIGFTLQTGVKIGMIVQIGIKIGAVTIGTRNAGMVTLTGTVRRDSTKIVTVVLNPWLGQGMS